MWKDTWYVIPLYLQKRNSWDPGIHDTKVWISWFLRFKCDSDNVPLPWPRGLASHDAWGEEWVRSRMSAFCEEEENSTRSISHISQHIIGSLFLSAKFSFKELHSKIVLDHFSRNPFKKMSMIPLKLHHHLKKNWFECPHVAHDVRSRLPPS